MNEHLIFQLTATLASMGELAGHERRGTLAWPGRSAIIGLLGAAMGLRREDDFSALDSLKIGVAVFDEGAPLRDYHTVETVPSAAVKRPQSRPEALTLGRGRTNTTITLRDYRTGPLYGVVVWGGELGALAEALRRPRFTLYLGRKACPLAAPPAPQIITAAGPVDALSHLRLPPWRGAMRAHRLIVDEETEIAGNAKRVEERRDIAIDRHKWHFAVRRAGFHSVEIDAEGAS